MLRRSRAVPQSRGQASNAGKRLPVRLGPTQSNAVACLYLLLPCYLLLALAGYTMAIAWCLRNPFSLRQSLIVTAVIGVVFASFRLGGAITGGATVLGLGFVCFGICYSIRRPPLDRE